MFEQRDAIIRLLRDEDTHTVELVKSQLATHGRGAIPHLQELLSLDDARVARHVRELLGRIDAQEALAELTELCREFPDHGELDALEYAAFLLARAVAPGTDAESARRQLDEWGEALGKRLGGARSVAGRVKILADFFGGELGLHGNVENYYTVGNSLLPEVVQSRLGIPITLSLIYLFTGARAGIVLEGVSFPGHFLIRHDEVILDPFERGRVRTPADCAAILTRQNMTVNPVYFEAAPARVILRRMLANLLYLYQRENRTLAATLEEWIHDLEFGR